jgi:hypothetical protein
MLFFKAMGLNILAYLQQLPIVSLIFSLIFFLGCELGASVNKNLWLVLIFHLDA